MGLAFLLSGVSILCGLGPDLHEFLPGPAPSAADFTIKVWATSPATDSTCMRRKNLLMQKHISHQQLFANSDMH